MFKWIKIDEACMAMGQKERRLWLTLLSLAGYDGSVSVSKSTLSHLTGLSTQEVKTALKQLIANQFINQLANQLGAKGRTNLIICDASSYIVQRKPYFKGANQLANQFANQLPTNSVVTCDDNQKTTTAIPVMSFTQAKETLPGITHNNIPPVIQGITAPLASSPSSPSKKSGKPKQEFAPGVSLTQEEYGKLVSEYGEGDARGAIDYLAGYKVEKAYKNKDDYLSIRRWVIDAYHRQQQERSRIASNNNGPKNATRHNQDVLRRFNSQFNPAGISPDEQ